ncbi:glycosyltransferase family 2 protein [Paraburkholderia caribensis]|uniref:glycosyltransferase family 2 protein n=1 Tax=Paraburkholderia caribensis TaxID=75105 RepID=UPI001591A4BA|nr:glycosyltransferase family 2 protein [Paraburkholderia caribensis]
MRSTKIGIVTVLFKSDSVIDGFIESMNAQTFREFHILFVENDVANFHCEHEIRKGLTVPFTFVRNRDNAGVAAGNNQGIDFFLGDPSYTHILFLNNDIEVNPDFLHRQVDVLANHPEVDALAPKMFYYTPAEKVWYAGGKLSYLKGGCRHFGHNKRDRLTRDALYRVDYAPTCSLIVKSWPLRDSGIRMWEELFVYYDDTVFCHELTQAGIRIYFTPRIHLWHKISSSTGGAKSEFSRYFMTRNWLYWGIRRRNLAVLTSALALGGFHFLVRNKVEMRAMRDALQMTRSLPQT